MRPVGEWEEKDIDELYRDQIMESLSLEYKASGALKNDDPQKKELFKDVAATNSSRGIVV